MPGSSAVQAAFDQVRAASEPWLFNHVVRSWLFAAELAQARKLRPDPELLAVAALFQRFGLTPGYTGKTRFEVFGADVARSFAAGHRIDARGQQLVWDAVALSTSATIAQFKEPEVACLNAGITLDVAGVGVKELDAPVVDTIVTLAPRMGMKRRFEAAMVGIARDHPSVTYDNFIRDFGNRYVEGYKAPSSVDRVQGAPFQE